MVKERGWDSPCDTPKKKSIRHSAAEIDLPGEIRTAIFRRGSIPSEWQPITRHQDPPDLRAGENLLLYRRNGKRWKALRNLIRAPRTGEPVIALRHIKPIRWGRSALSEAEKWAHHNTIRNFFFCRAPGYLNTEPTVHICHPANGAAIACDDNRYTCRRLEDYTFQPGGALESQ